MNNYNTQQDFDSKITLLRQHFDSISESDGFVWDEFSAILMLKIKKNWTVESSNSNYQINSNHVINFFPILQVSESFPHWRMSMNGKVPKAVLTKLGEQITEENDWLDGKITYRHKIQNSYPYLQLTLEDSLRTLKNALRENNQIYFLKKNKEDKYYILATREELFKDDKFLAINPSLSQSDDTKFHIGEISSPNNDSSKLSHLSRNRILYGAPGTGKSYKLKKQANKYFNSDNRVRITFTPNYSFQQFVGAYKPTPIYKSLMGSEKLYEADNKTLLPKQNEPIINYSFVAGPFIDILIKARKRTDENFLIIIEEINRANVSSVFGPVFQLLDRNDNQESEYAVEFNADVTTYLRSQGIENPERIKIPNNLFLWSTMNNADQGVLPLDSAFKRRWSFEYIGINDSQEKVSDWIITLGSDKCFKWNGFREVINTYLKNNNVNEDKLLGPFFMNKKELLKPDSVSNKLLLYLKEDVLKHKSSQVLFVDGNFSDLIEKYKKNPLSIFTEGAIKELRKHTDVCDGVKNEKETPGFGDRGIEDKENKEAKAKAKAKKWEEIAEFLGGKKAIKGNAECIELKDGTFAKYYKPNWKDDETDGGRHAKRYWYWLNKNALDFPNVIYDFDDLGFLNLPKAIIETMIEKGNKEGLWNEDGVKKIMFYVDEDYEDYNNIVFGNVVDELKIDISEYIHQLS